MGPVAARTLTVLPGGKPEPLRDAAVIDLGSNSWRLVAYRFSPAGSWARTGELQEPVRIAEGLEASGVIGAAAIARGLETLEMFARWCRARGIAPEAVSVVATSALRDAANGDEILARATERSGFDIRVLSAGEEARYGYLAAVNSTTLHDGMTLDLGGGSLQLVAVRKRQAIAFGSWPLGAVRVTERLLARDRALSRKELKRVRAALRAELPDLPPADGRGTRVVAMGGAVRNLAGAWQRKRGVDAAGLQGCRLAAGDLRELVVTLAARAPAARALPGIKPARADVILAAALVLEAVLERGEFPALEVTRAGLREGVFFATRLLPHDAPLMPDVRAAAVRNLAVECRADLRRAERVAALALELHDSMATANVFKAAAGERELLWAAGMLHEVGLAVGFDGHAAHSRYVILHVGLAGHGPRELALIAQIVRYHRKGSPGLDELAPLAAKGDADVVARCALLLRVAAHLDAGVAPAVTSARIVAERRRLLLALTGDARLARWSVERQLGDGEFRRVFGRRLELG
jgi:exopolyphosphatase/guanosine-5'-triphosphate,3'-diphosphate pyrophosphatase